jgi:hypothetical protein
MIRSTGDNNKQVAKRKCVLVFFPKIGTGWGADIGDFVQN